MMNEKGEFELRYSEHRNKIIICHSSMNVCMQRVCCGLGARM